MSTPILAAIRRLLVDSRVAFQEITHLPTYTSEESAAARGESLEVGAKALLVKVDETFRLFVLAAHRKFDSAAVKRELRAKRIRFATSQELEEHTGLVPGSVPPFGEPILPFPLYADESIGQHVDRVAFNAGSLTDSIVMKASDWKSLARPQQLKFSKDEVA